MKFKKGFLNIGKLRRPTAVYRDGIITVHYHNGSGISQKKINLAERTATTGASTNMYCDWVVQTSQRTIRLEGQYVNVY